MGWRRNSIPSLSCLSFVVLQKGRTALGFAAGGGHVAVIELLLNRGAKIEGVSDSIGRSADHKRGCDARQIGVVFRPLAPYKRWWCEDL